MTHKTKIILFSIIFAIGILQIIAGYFWMSQLNTSDFNFGPAFIIMLGAGEIIALLIVLIVGFLSRKGR